jgi:hypothetical protein
MLEEDAIAVVAMLKKGAETMKAREEALAASTVALNQAIVKLQQLPATLGQQTSQYIAAGVRQSIQDDFSRPIADAVKGPLSELQYATNQARDLMREVRKESRLQTWNWVAVMVLLGVAIGGLGCYGFFVRDINQVNDRLDSIQQQITPRAQIPDTKPVPGASSKGHHAHPAAAPSTAP